MKLSIVATLYQTAPHLKEFYRRASLAAKKVSGDDYEIVLVNDGSPDASLAIAIALSSSDPNLVVVDLSRNFGHHRAMMTGLVQARGNLVFLIDSDLEEEPEWLFLFQNVMTEQKCDVVYGIQVDRRDRNISRWTGLLFYKLFRVLTQLPLPDNIVVARLMTREYVNALVLHEEREIFMAGLWVITGFDQRPFPVTKHRTSRTTYNLRRKIAQFINSITSFSSMPLVGIFAFGSFISAISTIYVVYLIVHWLFSSKLPGGWTSVIVSVWLLGGVIIAFIGIVGIYIAKIFSEVKQRPYTIIRRIYRGGIGGTQ